MPLPLNPILSELQEVAISRVQAGENCVDIIIRLVKEVNELMNQQKTPISLVIRTVTNKENDLLNPLIATAVTKLFSYQDEIKYQTKKGRAADSVDKWIQDTFIDSGKMTLEEISLIPMWAFRQFNNSIYQALQDKKRIKAK